MPSSKRRSGRRSPSKSPRTRSRSRRSAVKRPRPTSNHSSPRPSKLQKVSRIEDVGGAKERLKVSTLRKMKQEQHTPVGDNELTVGEFLSMLPPELRNNNSLVNFMYDHTM